MKTYGLCRLCADPEVKYLENENNTCVARFRGASNRKYKKEGQPDADFFNYVAFGKKAEFVGNYLRKGSKVFIDGELRSGSYEKDGITFYTTEILVDNIEFADAKKDNSQTEGAAASVPNYVPNDLPEFAEIGSEEELPF